MGLDMYAYARPPRKRNSDDDVSICDWRKHNRLQGWMRYYYLERDLEFVTEARKMLDKGYRVFYSCWY